MGIRSKTYNLLRLIGLDPWKSWQTIISAPRFVRDLRRYQKQASADGRFPLRVRNLKPLLLDHTDQAGEIGGHYFHQDLWAARKIFEARPPRHVDIGSRIDGFVAHVLAFMPVEVIDIRPLSSSIRGLTFIQADATHLSNIAEQSVQSLSCLHAAEHFGLGRYTDPIDSDACFKAMRAMQRVLALGGTLYFSVPIGIERVEFNAQRVFAPKTIVSSFDGLTLECFSAVDDEGRFHPDASMESFTGARYACGLFEFRKREHAGSVPS